MPQTRCPYCHQYIDDRDFAMHTESHRKLMPDGQQREYVTLPEEDRYEDELNDVPVAYLHKRCNVATRMPDEIVRSYLQNPYLYGADTTFCAGCHKQVPYSECQWTETGENLQHYFDELRANKPELRPAGFGAASRSGSSTAAQSETSDSTGANWSIIRIGLGVGAVILVTILGRLPRAVIKNVAQNGQQVQPAFPNNQAAAAAAEEEDWNAKIQRGEDVPDAILALAGVSPAKYKEYRLRLKLSQLEEEDKFEEALKTMDEALLESPDSEFLHNAKAWLLATCKTENVRNGKLAVEHATKACELTNFTKATYLDTLAAADAQAADFESAVQHVQSAIELTTDPAQKQRFLARLELYKNKESFHQ